VRMVPGLAIIIPLYILFKNLALLDTYLAIILAHLFYTLPFSIWIMTGYVWSIPKEVEEAAKLDGCTNVQILFRIVFPLLLPGIAAIGVMSFMFSWGEFFFAMILTKSYDIRTLPVILASALEVGEQFVYGPVNALAAISIVPSIAISLLAQKLLIAGLTKGAIKA
ncbi:MAG: carbohydrate ABC transporter permease, partial [Nitrososphaerota archaeon]